MGLDTPSIFEDPLKRITLFDHKILVKKISDFTSKNTNKFFEAISLNSDFLKENPETQSNNPIYYRELQQSVAKLRITNDTAERGMILIQKNNNLSTKSEEQTQFILRVMAQHRKIFPSITKTAVNKQI